MDKAVYPGEGGSDESESDGLDSMEIKVILKTDEP